MNAPTGHAVVIAGAGPTGLMLAGELALAGADVAIVERRATQADGYVAWAQDPAYPGLGDALTGWFGPPI
jgi:2-polyprenyl-6-methoxyphenol hydroxylase-like FAD-dependent oxidoreductase